MHSSNVGYFVTYLLERFANNIWDEIGYKSFEERWGINTAVVSAGGRIGCHSALTLVFTWLFLRLDISVSI